MDDLENFNKTPLPKRDHFYSHLNREDITDADFIHAKRVGKDYKKEEYVC